VAVASQHLRNLRAAGMLQTRRDAQRIYYRLADESVFEAYRAVRTVGERRLAEIDRAVGEYLSDRTSMRAVCVGELLELLREDAAVVLDVRPEEEYRAGHIAGARSVPVERLEEYLCDLPEEVEAKEIVAYCRGPYCVFSDEAVRLLEARGYRASRLTEGSSSGGPPGCRWRAEEIGMGRESVDAKTLREWLERGERVTVVDVRHAEEHAEWSVPGSVNFDAYDALKSGEPDAMDAMELPNDGPVVTVCGAGRSSAVTVPRAWCTGRGSPAFWCRSSARASPRT